MTDRYAAYIVTMQEDIREDVDVVKNALMMVKGVISVDPVPSDFGVHIGYERARAELIERITGVLWAKDRT